MKRWLKWGAAVAGSALARLPWSARAIVARKSEQAQLAAKLPADRSRRPRAGRPDRRAADRTRAHARDLGRAEGRRQRGREGARRRRGRRHLTVREGDRVVGRAGARAASTRPSSSWRLRQAEQQAASAKAQLDIARARTGEQQGAGRAGFHLEERARHLGDAAPPARRPSLQAAQAAAELARKALRDTEIRAPIAGMVSQRCVQPGERVAAGRAAARDRRPVAHRSSRPRSAPDDVGAVRVGSAARLQVDGLARARAGARRAHQPEHAGRHARGDGLPRAAARGRRGRCARACSRAAASRSQRRHGAGRAGLGGARRPGPPYVLRRRRRQGRAARRDARRARRRRASTAAPRRGRDHGRAWRRGDTVVRGSVGSLRDGHACAPPGGGTAAAPSARRALRARGHVVHPRLDPEPGHGHDGHAGLRRARAVQLPAPRGRPVPERRLPGRRRADGLPGRLAGDRRERGHEEGRGGGQHGRRHQLAVLALVRGQRRSSSSSSTSTSTAARPPRTCARRWR